MPRHRGPVSRRGLLPLLLIDQILVSNGSRESSNAHYGALRRIGSDAVAGIQCWQSCGGRNAEPLLPLKQGRLICSRWERLIRPWTRLKSTVVVQLDAHQPGTSIRYVTPVRHSSTSLGYEGRLPMALVGPHSMVVRPAILAPSSFANRVARLHGEIKSGATTRTQICATCATGWRVCPCLLPANFACIICLRASFACISAMMF
jgi:hypothetical protein